MNQVLANAYILSSDISYFLPLLYNITLEYGKNVDDITVLELGTRGGESTLALLSAVTELVKIGRQAKLTSADIHPMLDYCQARPNQIPYGLPNYIFIESDDMDLVKTWDKPIDILFVDTSHQIDHTHQELKHWMPKVKVGGYAIWHDTCSRPEGVGEPLATFANGNKDQWEYTDIKVITGLGIFKRIK